MCAEAGQKTFGGTIPPKSGHLEALAITHRNKDETNSFVGLSFLVVPNLRVKLHEQACRITKENGLSDIQVIHITLTSYVSWTPTCKHIFTAFTQLMQWVAHSERQLATTNYCFPISKTPLNLRINGRIWIPWGHCSHAKILWSVSNP